MLYVHRKGGRWVDGLLRQAVSDADPKGISASGQICGVQRFLKRDLITRTCHLTCGLFAVDDGLAGVDLHPERDFLVALKRNRPSIATWQARANVGISDHEVSGPDVFRRNRFHSIGHDQR